MGEYEGLRLYCWDCGMERGTSVPEGGGLRADRFCHSCGVVFGRRSGDRALDNVFDVLMWGVLGFLLVTGLIL